MPIDVELQYAFLYQLGNYNEIIMYCNVMHYNEIIM